MSALRLMSPPQLHLRGQSSQNNAQSPSPGVQYRTIQGCSVSTPGRHLGSGPGLNLQALSQGLISSIGGLSQHLDKLGKQLISGGRSNMVAETQVPRLRLEGRWNKDKSASDMQGYGKSLDLMGIHGIKKRTAMVMMDGVEIIQDDSAITTKFVTKVPQWRPTEVYSFKGPSLMSRRDQKKGQQTAVVGTTPDGELEVTVTWDEPNPGCFREVYRVPQDGVLHIESFTTINGQTESTLQVYRKHDG
jgi:hypothetical protein